MRTYEEQGYEVDAVLSAAETLEKPADKNYNLIVSDIRMPGLSGEQFCEQVQKTRIVKPFQLDELPELVERTLVTIDEVGDDFATPAPGNEYEPDRLETYSRT